MTTEDSLATSSACDCPEKIEAMKTASDLLAQGKKNMVCGEVPKAVGLYEEAVQLLVKSCGEMSRECADAYFCCGSALLELGRMETNVLGAALEGVEVEEEKEEEVCEQFEKPPADEGEERDKLRVEVYQAMAEGDREERFQKVLKEPSTDSACIGICDTSLIAVNMDIDTEAKQREDKSVIAAVVKDEQHLNNVRGKEETTRTVAKEESQPEERIDDSVGRKENIAEKIDPSTADDKKCDGGSTLAMDGCQSGKSDHIGPEITEKCQSDKTTSEANAAEKCSTDKTVSGADLTDKCSTDKTVSGADLTEKCSTDKTVSGADVAEKSSSGADVAEKSSSGADVAEKSSSGADVTEKCVTDKTVSRTDVTEKCVTDKTVGGVDVAEKSSSDNTVSGADVTEKCVTDKTVCGVDATEKSSSDKTVGGVDVTEKSSSDKTVSGVDVDEKCVTDKIVSGADVAEKCVTDKTVSGADVAEKCVTDKTVSGADVAEKCVTDKTVSGADVAEKCVTDKTVSGADVAEKCVTNKTDDSEVVVEKCQSDKTDVADATEKCQSDKSDVADATEKCQSNEINKNGHAHSMVVDNKVENVMIVEVCDSDSTIAEVETKNTSAGDECEPMDATENGLVTEITGDGKVKVIESVGSDSKLQEQVKSNEPESETIAAECVSGMDSSNQVHPGNTKQEGENVSPGQAEERTENKGDHVEILMNAGKIDTVMDDVQKVESRQPANSNNTEVSLQDSQLNESKEKSLSDKPTEPSQDDVEMADSDAMDVGEDEAEDDDDDEETNTDDIQESEGNDDEKEEVPNFQLAWEYLDLAKVLYLKSDTADDHLKAAQCHLKLGELSMETGQHATATEDLRSALNIQQKYLPSNDRLIAETLYQLGVAYGLSAEYEQSVQHYTQAISVIESKIESLSKLVQEKEMNGENKENAELGECARYLDEIKELQQLVPDIKNKIEDTNQEAKDIEQIKCEAKETLGFSQPSKTTGSPAKSEPRSDKAEQTVASDGVVECSKVSDIAHLVRKKRKPDSDLCDADTLEVKKVKPDGDCRSDLDTNNETTQLETNIVVEGCSLQPNEDSSVVSVELVA